MSTSERIRQMLTSGHSTRQIALELGVTMQRVHVVKWHLQHPEKKAEYARSYWHRNKRKIKAREQERRRQHKKRREEQRKALQARIRELEKQLKAANRPARRMKPIEGPAHWYG